jgi:O-antigen/teichoic acid export membrane protein
VSKRAGYTGIFPEPFGEAQSGGPRGKTDLMSVESSPESADGNEVSEVIADLPSLAPQTPPFLLGPVIGFFKSTGTKSFWVLSDQAIVSIGNFATTILIGRAAAASQFGAFGMLMEVYLFFNSLQSALVVYPLTVRGAVLSKEGLQRMASACLLLTLVLCIPLSLAMAGTTAIFQQSAIMLWVCLAMVIAQIQETLRRTLLAHLQFRDAIPGDAISYLLQAAILFVLVQRGQLNLARAFVVIGGTSALGAVLQALQIGLRPISLGDLKAVVADFWHLGRWILFSNFAAVIGSLAYNWTLALHWGTTQVAFLYVVITPMKVVNPLITGLSGVIIPSVSRAHHHSGLHRAKAIGMKYAGLGLVILIPYLLILLCFPEWCIRILFPHHAEYLGLTGFLRIFVLTYTLSFVGNMALACLNGLGNSRASFIATFANALFSACVAIPLAYYLGLKGVILGGCLATAIFALFAVYFLFAAQSPTAGRSTPQTAA